MSKKQQHWALLLLLLCLAVPLAEAQAAYTSRVALVIGNANYKTVPKLRNSVNDADLISQSLKSVGFEVLRYQDLDYRGMNRAVRAFSDALSRNGKGTVGLFYYAGHAVQVGGSNYLIPVDAEIVRESDFLVEAIDANTVIGTMEYAQNPLNIIVLDACRNNPFTSGTRGAARGLARMDAPTGTLIAYATAPGQTALDGDMNNSPYTLALSQYITRPNLPVEQMFKKVRIEVMSSTGNQQIPWEASSLTGDFFFADAALTNLALAPDESSEPEPVPPAAQPEFVSTLSTPAQAPAAPEFTSSPAITQAESPKFEQTTVLSSAPATSFSQSPAVAEPTQVAAINPDPGSIDFSKPFRDCNACPLMVAIPEGSFTMGSSSTRSVADRHLGPAHQVNISRPFAIGKYEVTFQEWDACFAEGSCTHRPSDYGWGRGNQPVVDVSWEHAQQFISWLNRKTGQNYRLPTEAEWEYAARAGSSTQYYWGEGLETNHANCWNCGSQWGNKQPAPVGSFVPNAFGVNDMSGNVWEWTADCWNPNYENAPADGKAWEQGNCKLRVMRGGAWMTGPDSVTVTNRNKQNPGFRRNFTGIRVARNLNP